MQLKSFKKLVLILAASSLVNGCWDDDFVDVDYDTNTTDFYLAISDAPVDDASKVVITLDKVTLYKGDAFLVFDTFTNSDEDIFDADTVAIDLLQYQGSSQFSIIESAGILSGNYTKMELTLLTGDATLSYVEESDGAIKELNLTEEVIELGEFNLRTDKTERFTVEFNLRQSLVYQDASDTYNLKSNGIALTDNRTAGAISGTVDLDALLADINCGDSGHLVYLYSGSELDPSLLSDLFDASVEGNGAPAGAIAPYASTGITMNNESGEYMYEFGFVPEGSYTVAYACQTGENGDDPEFYDNILVPQPNGNIVELIVNALQVRTQDFPL
ncbi:DUF4382 domain-containing protein [Corallincola luteus]|uniref:DUF4382 domain-containing protein n=1 Tax=Corallincola luteus TaxID=1775177 RepID=A0ABY2AM63_9GAMM|nr:DUF4382 domain-containing protein [Corallincola luteus]TCI03678.1 DUF4382 domain-containing protein [Corallincola luteus]